MRKKVLTKERFWAKVNKTTDKDCWLWTAAKDPKGYGVFYAPELKSKNTFAHRYSYFLHYGELNPDLSVLHRCDNPSCVNPNHLFEGTQLDNMRDMISKGRRFQADNRGEKNHKALLTWDDVRTIRALYATGNYTNKQLAEIYNVKYGTMADVTNGRHWKE